MMCNPVWIGVVITLLSGALHAGHAQRTFTHPGLLHTAGDFQRMRQNVQAGEQPWLDGWRVLEASPHAQLDWRPRPTETVVRGGSGQNFPVLFNDVHAAYQLALRWKVSGDVRYADKAIEVLNAWSSTLQEIQGNADRFLAAGIYGYQFANAAEIMRTCEAWPPEDQRRFQQMMLKVFYPVNHDFLVNHNGAAITNYWANWDLCSIASMLSIGVLCDRADIYDEAIDYLHHGRGNGALDKLVYYLHPGNLGQWQESGRDQGHTTLGIALVGPICETAWNQGDDLYGYRNNRVLAGAEYIARYNLGEDVPYQKYAWGIGQRGDYREQPEISAAGRGSQRNGYELIVNHYVKRLGVAAPYSARYAKKLRPERGGGGHASSFDQLGFGTLTATLEPQVQQPAPSGLTARKHGPDVVLSWWGAAGADHYRVKRANQAGEVSVLAEEVAGLLTYTDHDVRPGSYQYTVTGVRDGQETGRANIVRVDTQPRLRWRLQSDGRRGLVLRDSANQAGAATLHGGRWIRGRAGGGAVALDGRDDYVELPSGVVSQLADFTVAAWVSLDADQAFARVFDFGDDRGQYMYLTPRTRDGRLRFGVATVSTYNEQSIEAPTALPTGGWTHVAVTLAGRTGTLYVNGDAVATNNAIDFPPYRLGATPRCWLGRSQFAADPYLAGQIGDLRIYDGALSTREVAALANRENR